MKQLLINLKSLIKRGLLRIFPRPDLNTEILKPWSIPALCAILSVLSVVSCSTPRYATQLVHDVSVDTVYLSNTQYDSIYIFKDKLTDRTKDTIYVKDVSVEYRYKLLRDTIYKSQVDSIPYQVTVTEVKEITRPLTWFDHLTRLTFWFIFGYLISILIFKLKRVF